MKKILDLADIRVVEFAALTKVSKATVHNWIKGTPIGTELVRDQVETLISRIQAAVKDGKLPLKDAVGRERLRILKVILQ